MLRACCCPVIVIVVAGMVPRPAAAQVQYVRHFSEWPEIESITVTSTFFGPESAINRDFLPQVPCASPQPRSAYDYSVHLIFDSTSNLFRLYTGGRWLQCLNPDPCHITWSDGDHVLQHVSATGAGGSWTMPHVRPEFPQGRAEGFCDHWCSGQYLEPEVVRVAGTFYMYTQVEIVQGEPIDYPPGAVALGNQGDRIQLHLSSDGLNWTRWSADRGVVVGLDNPTITQLHHQQTLYVPWDRDRRPWWLYIPSIEWRPGGAVDFDQRIRSADPTTYDWAAKERFTGIGWGGQMCYAIPARGGPVYMRIESYPNFDRRLPDGTPRTDPVLFFSRDGLTWVLGDEGPLFLQGSDDLGDNPSCFFNGIATIDGTGELRQSPSGAFEAIYGCSTAIQASNPHLPGLDLSDIGVGAVRIQIATTARAQDVWMDSIYSGFEDGSFARPWNTMNEALAHAAPGSVIGIKAGDTPGSLFINQEVTLTSYGGAVVLGR